MGQLIVIGLVQDTGLFMPSAFREKEKCSGLVLLIELMVSSG